MDIQSLSCEGQGEKGMFFIYSAIQYVLRNLETDNN